MVHGERGDNQDGLASTRKSRREASRLAIWNGANDQRGRWTAKKWGSARMRDTASGWKFGDGLRDALDVRGVSDA
jgi:hypothetical protein